MTSARDIVLTFLPCADTFFNSVSLWVFVCCFFFLQEIYQVKPRTRKPTKVAKREDRKKTRDEKTDRMGRKKIQIARIMDERNRHVSARKICTITPKAKLARN